MVSCCNRRLYKGNSYEICLPITDTGVTSVSFYTSGDIVIEKEGEIVDDTMCFELTKEELDLLPDGVLRYSYEDFDSNTRYVVVTPGDYSGTTLEDIIADAFDSGYTAGQEDCSGDTCEGVFESGYTSGHTDGIAEQKAKLVPTAITQNGTYSREDGGFSQVEVNVPTGQTINNQVKSYSIGHWQTTLMQTGEDKYMYTLINRPTILTYDSGYTGLEKLILNMGIDAYEAVDLGKILQRAKMVSTAITENGTYSREDGGFSQVEVNVPQTGHTDQEMQDSWNSGYTSGYTDGLNACSGGNEDLIANLQGDYFIIPEGTTKLRDYALYATSFSSITIPSSVTSIGNYAFSNVPFSSITIPSSVTSIGNYAFANCLSLTEIVIPDTVESLGSHVVFNCSQLTAATLPSGLTRISDYLFGYTSLTGITLPTGITSIGKSAFTNSKLTGNIVIPSGVTYIGTGAFRDCSGLTSMTFEGPVPATITADSNYNASLGSSAYTWPIYVPCEAVEDYKTAWPYYAHRISCQQEPEPQTASTAITISVPDNLEPGDTGSTSVSTSPTGATTNLSYSSSDNSVATVDNNGNITAVGTGTTNICVTDSISQITECVQLAVNNPILGEGDISATIRAKNTTGATTLCSNSSLGSIDKMAIDGIEITPVSSYTFGDTDLHTLDIWYLTSNVPYDAFEYAERIETAVIKDRMTVIGGRAFFWCTGLTSVQIGSGTTAINNSAFQGNKSLTSIVIPDSVNTIGTYVFSGCTSLTSATIGSGITSISEGMFKGCSGLTELTINGNIGTIGNSAFLECKSLSAYPFTNALTTIGGAAFKGCESLSNVVMPNSVTSAGDEAFAGCSGMTAVTLSTGLTEIANYLFSSCSTLHSVSIPDTVSKIGGHSFEQCSTMTGVSLSSGLTEIGDSAFEYCSYLRGIDIPETVTKIGAFSFRFDTAINANGITVRSAVPSQIGSQAFASTSNSPIYVPAESVETYKNSTATNHYWATYADRIQPIQ